MKCYSCGTENASNVKFCSECGAPAGVPCPDCGIRNPGNAAVCGGCGRTLETARAAAAERRHITVLFADIAGSTGFAERLDPEELRDLYSDYQGLCTDVVRRYDGHIAQYLGD